MKKKHGTFLVIIALAMTGVSLAAQEEGTGAKINLTLDFNATAVSVNSDGVVDSFTDSGFGKDNESTLGFSYENEFFGGTFSLGFGPETLRIFDGEIGHMSDVLSGKGPVTIDELYAWIKPFGENFKFTGGIFENTDGVADYTDDIDNFGMGVFILSEGGELPFGEPEATTDPSLTNGFLTGATFGLVTVQFLLAPNYSKESASDMANSLLGPVYVASGIPYTPIDAGERFFRIGGRVIADLGPTQVSGLFKMFRWPMLISNTAKMAADPGKIMDLITFGLYGDITIIENLGVSLGYTGYMVTTDDRDYNNVLWNGIDLRATWTSIEGLSISTHNNISFAIGVDNDWLWKLGKNGSFLTLYNAIGATKELTKRFSLNTEIGNVFSKTDRGGIGDMDYDTVWGQAKLISSITENVEFTAGLKVDFTVQTGVDNSTIFSVPVGIKVSF